MMITENILKAIEILEIKNNELKLKNMEMKNELKRLNDAIANIDFDYGNMHIITRKISDLYYELKMNEGKIKWNNEDLSDCYESLIDSVSQEENDKIEKQKQKENERNLNSDLREISAKYEFVEILNENKIKIKKDDSVWSRNSVIIERLSDNSYQFKNSKKNINVKRKSTVIKYLKESMN